MFSSHFIKSLQLSASSVEASCSALGRPRRCGRGEAGAPGTRRGVGISPVRKDAGGEGLVESKGPAQAGGGLPREHLWEEDLMVLMGRSLDPNQQFETP